jgi:site-specific DNA recombinase
MASRHRDTLATVAAAPVRCAIYTRKSTNENLDSDFNSLDAQRESAENYIRAQQSEGWIASPDHYDDGAYSGATIDRPALQRLMSDVRAGRVDTIVVYKIDRLSRSLMDFTKLVGELERYDVSLVAVTQQFNTTTSMGRLTLNILLSFAQFEREVTAERIQDKMAAARKKGKYVGGIPPLGYDVDRPNKRLVVNVEEAVLVRYVFRRFLQTEGAVELVRDLNQKGHLTKSWVTQKGTERPGKPWHKNYLYRMLRNPVYMGKVQYKDEVYDGEQEPIIDQALWDQVQKAIAVPAKERSNRNRAETPGLLRGMLRCGHCSTSMVVHFTRQHGRQYRYYVCHRATRTSYDNCPVKSVSAGIIENLVKDRLRRVFASTDVVKETLAAVRRRQAEEHTQVENEKSRIEEELRGVEACGQRLLEALRQDDSGFVRGELVRLDGKKKELETQLLAVQERLGQLDVSPVDVEDLASELGTLDNIWGNLFPGEQQRLVRTVIKQVVLHTDRVEITIRGDGLQSVADLLLAENAPAQRSEKGPPDADTVISIPMQFKRRGGRKEIVLPEGATIKETSTNKALLLTLARALRWSDLLEQGRFPSVRALAAAVGLERSYVARLLNITLLAPDIVKAAVPGDEPPGLSVAKLRQRLPARWDQQLEWLREE